MQETLDFIAKNYKLVGVFLTMFSGLTMAYNKLLKHSKLLYCQDGEIRMATKRDLKETMKSQLELCQKERQIIFGNLATKTDLVNLEKTLAEYITALDRKSLIAAAELKEGNRRFEQVEKALEKLAR